VDLCLPQIPLSIGNAIIATEDTLKTYYGRQADKVEAGRLSFGMGCFNILSGLFGGIPCCHGCGGATAHYRFGARSGTATLFAGIFYVLVAAAIYFFGTSIFNYFPYPVLGILLIYVGIEHGLLIRDMTSRVDLAIVLVIGSIAFATKKYDSSFYIRNDRSRNSGFAKTFRDIIEVPSRQVSATAGRRMAFTRVFY